MHILFASVEAPVFILDYQQIAPLQLGEKLDIIPDHNRVRKLGRLMPAICVSTLSQKLIGVLNSWHNSHNFYPWLNTPSGLEISCVVTGIVKHRQEYDDDDSEPVPPQLFIKISMSGPSERKSFYCSRMLWALRMDPHRALYEAKKSPQGPLPTWQIACEFDRASVKARVVMDSTQRFTAVDAYTGITAPQLQAYKDQIPHLRVKLYPHQLEALQWMITQEDASPPSLNNPKQLWERGPNNRFLHKFHKTLNTFSQSSCPLSGGGLLADSMGKTLSTLALISATRKNLPQGFAKTTLIIVPLSVLNVWKTAIQEQCQGLEYVAYYPREDQTTPKFTKYDIVLTNYHTLGGENGSHLLQIAWRRVVVDEGHNLRNSETTLYKRAAQLKASARWVLTGTPTDLRSLLSFLRLCPPLQDIDYWKKTMGTGKDDKTDAVTRAGRSGNLRPSQNTSSQELMGCICLRRTKDMVGHDGKRIVELPDVLYNQTAAEKGSTQEWNLTTSVNKVQMLKIITRLRQLAIHPSLIPVAQATEEPKQMKRETRKNPSRRPKCKGPECSLVVDQDQGLVHVHLCRSSLPVDHEADDADLDDPELSIMCPCGAALVENDALNVADQAINPGVSAKLDMLVTLVHAVPNGEKSLVFSNFVRFLKIAERRFINEGIKCALYHGGMSAQDRTLVIDRFCAANPSSPRVMLISIHAVCSWVSLYMCQKLTNAKLQGGVGLNLTAANHVFLIDPAIDGGRSWSPVQSAIEHQAIDRVNRIGQQREVEVIRLVAQNTIEERVRSIQNEKATIMQQAKFS
ncbi:SNF2 family N-terminal domain-containing protein [Roridomyces roridus]|uniref:SNF2 family N-terminal domain-containing protein n=1 Tax=Roridomyces roridus TaxID=1738132 RepID=A0AAD7CJG2_9AGAR|nr:SNF2 family N-terminal domain-containing protein [Roridomyces roridus]